MTDDDHQDRELPDQLARIWERYQALAATAAANRVQLDGSWRHYQVTRSVWGRALSAARHGTLAQDWRTNADWLYTTRERPTEQSVRDAEDLAIHEVATTPRAAWEPFAARGDWRRALAAWSTAQHELTRHQYRTKRWLSAFSGATAAEQAALTRMDSVLEAREHDATEASYRAGLAAGGDDEDWRSWYRTRIIETWSPTDDSAYNLYYTVERQLREIDSGRAWVTGGDMLTITEHLPDIWRQLPPPATAWAGQIIPLKT